MPGGAAGRGRLPGRERLLSLSQQSALSAGSPEERMPHARAEIQARFSTQVANRLLSSRARLDGDRRARETLAVPDGGDSGHNLTTSSLYRGTRVTGRWNGIIGEAGGLGAGSGV